VKPLVLHDPLASALYFSCLGFWAVAEIALAIKTTGGGERGNRTHIALFAASYAGFALAILIAANVESLSMPGGGWWPVVVGLSIFLAGVAFRYWAIVTLGRFFVFVVAVQEDHRVVDSGPYAIVRHPGYLGLLAAVGGLGLALGNWLALAVCFLPPLIGFTRRIVAEERVLSEELGEPYRAYAARTRRLIPGIW
jgi:protein-S-isoprenylcysteine O-methyltransferase Ste14